jgi:hypothetical protein
MPSDLPVLFALSATSIACSGAIVGTPNPSASADPQGGSLDPGLPSGGDALHFVRTAGGELQLADRRYPNPAHHQAVDLVIRPDATAEVRCRADGGAWRSDCLGLPFQTAVGFEDGLLRCAGAWDIHGDRLYERCAVRPELAGQLGCLVARDAHGQGCRVCVDPGGHIASNDCDRLPPSQPRTDCSVTHRSGRMCIECAEVQGQQTQPRAPMCMRDDPNCPPGGPDGGIDGGEGGGPPADAGTRDSGEGGGPGPDGAAGGGSNAGGAVDRGALPPPSLACQPDLPPTDVYCHEINVTFQQTGYAYGYDCRFTGAWLPAALDAGTAAAIQIWLAAHGGAIDPAAPPCEAMLAMASSWSCEEDGDSLRTGERACARRVGRQRLAGYARARLIADGVCRP